MLDASFHHGDDSQMGKTEFDPIEATTHFGLDGDDRPDIQTATKKKPEDLTFQGDFDEVEARRKMTEKVKAEQEAKAARERKKMEDDLAKAKKAAEEEARRKAEADKAAADEEERKRKAEEESKKPKANWLERIRKEQLDKNARAEREKQERAEKLKKLLDSDSEDDENNFDYAGTTGNNLMDFL